jgi:hypothetical protein
MNMICVHNKEENRFERVLSPWSGLIDVNSWISVVKGGSHNLAWVALSNTHYALAGDPLQGHVGPFL